jgi:REP element-mobilizing transposase RayT
MREIERFSREYVEELLAKDRPNPDFEEDFISTGSYVDYTRGDTYNIAYEVQFRLLDDDFFNGHPSEEEDLKIIQSILENLCAKSGLKFHKINTYWQGSIDFTISVPPQYPILYPIRYLKNKSGEQIIEAIPRLLAFVENGKIWDGMYFVSSTDSQRIKE